MEVPWLKTLEEQFETAYSDLDGFLSEMYDSNQDVIHEGRLRMTSLGAAFLQLNQQARKMLGANAKLRQELVDTRKHLNEARTAKESLQQELNRMRLELQATQAKVLVQEHAGGGRTSETKIREIRSAEHIHESLVHQLLSENAELESQTAKLQAELFRVKEYAKHLDRELVGRIQQIQLLNRDLKYEEHERLWNQLEREIHLSRHGAVLRSSRYESKIISTHENTSTASGLEQRKIGQSHVVRLVRRGKEQLGISIAGGIEYDMPIAISELISHLPAARQGDLKPGDIILSVNGKQLTGVSHSEAVETLSQLEGEIFLEVIGADDCSSVDRDKDAASSFPPFTFSDVKREPEVNVHPGNLA